MQTLNPGSNLQVPIVSGPEVITCDNDEFEKTHNDADRKGLVLSVPFYNLEGQFKGSISAIVRTNVFHALLDQPDYALINKEHGYIARAKADENKPLIPISENSSRILLSFSLKSCLSRRQTPRLNGRYGWVTPTSGSRKVPKRVH